MTDKGIKVGCTLTKYTEQEGEEIICEGDVIRNAFDVEEYLFNDWKENQFTVVTDNRHGVITLMVGKDPLKAKIIHLPNHCAKDIISVLEKVTGANQELLTVEEYKSKVKQSND